MASPDIGQSGAAAQDAHGGELSPAHSAETASQWQLMRWRFLQHKAAVVSLVVLTILYLIAILVEFVAPYATDTYNIKYILAPPMRVRFVDADGRFHLRPFVYDYTTSRDPKSLRIVQVVNTESRHPIRFFVRGDDYRFWGLWRADRHLFGIDDPEALILLWGRTTRAATCSRVPSTGRGCRCRSASWG